MTLAQAKAAVLSGRKFGDVYEQLEAINPHDLGIKQDQLREWFCTTPNVPAQVTPATAKNGQHKPRVENSGKFCPDCGGARIVRTGSCETCQDCGRNEGCG